MKFMYNSPLFDDEEEEKKTPKAPDPFSERFLKTRQIILTGEINKDLADEIARQILILDSEDDKKPIYMYIDSPGGDVDAGFAIYDSLNHSSTYKTGSAYSFLKIILEKKSFCSGLKSEGRITP